MKKIVFIIGCLSVLFFTACQKELSDNFTAYPAAGNGLNDTIWHRNLPSTASVHDVLNSLFPQIIVDSFDVAKDTTMKYGDSLWVSFTAGTTGTTAGKAKLEILRLKSKGDYIKAFKATTIGGYLLETAGGFFIRVTKDGKELALATGSTIKIRFSDTEDPKPNMKVLYGKESIPPPITGIDTSFSWVRDTDTSSIKTIQTTTSGSLIKSYEMLSKNLRWISAERYIDSTQPKTKVTAILSPNYTSDNTVVFAVFTNQKIIVNLKADYPSRSFNANNIPLRSSIKLISLSKINDQFYLGIKDINDVGTVTSYTIVPEKKNLKDIIDFLNTL